MAAWIHTLRTSVHKQFGDKPQKEMLVESHCEAEVGPVVSELQTLESVALEVDLAGEVLLVENLHWNLALAAIRGAVMVAVEVQVVLDGTAGVLGLLGLAGGDGRCHGPEHHQNRDRREDGEEDGGVEPSADLAGQVPGDQQEQGEKQRIGEAVAASGIGRDRAILDGGILERLSHEPWKSPGTRDQEPGTRNVPK